MSQDEAEGTATADSTTEGNDQKNDPKQEETPDAQEQRQKAWAARRDLIEHAPSFVSSLVERDQYGVSGGYVQGNVIYQFGGSADATSGPASGPIPRAEIEALSAVFQSCPSFDEALGRLRTERVVVLSGGHATGRRSAAMMLLLRLGVERMRDLEPGTSPAALREHLEGAAGYVLCNLATSRSRPLRELHLRSMREQLERADGHLVITIEPSAALGDVPSVRWEPPPVEDMLRSHVTQSVGATAWLALRRLPPVQEFLDREHRPDEIARFARRLSALHHGETSEQELAAHGRADIAAQVTEWLTGEQPPLRDKAFLISLAVFDGASYAVTAELGDRLFALLQKTEDPHEPPRIPVFGSTRADRLQLARAQGHMGTEVTEWGAVAQFVAGFQNRDIPRALLHEVWNLHPSARPALVAWIEQLAGDGRPLVRTRAAAAAALLAAADLPSALALLIEPWADANSFGAWLNAANALTLAVLLKVPTVPQILHSWCTGENESRRWTAIRAYGLLGPVLHEEALQALLDVAGQQQWDDTEEEGEQEEALQLVDALELLLLAVEGPVLARLAEYVRDDHAVRDHALLAFLHACEQPEEDGDRPLVLGWYARATVQDATEEARHLATFWHTALNDRAHTSGALGVLRDWVRIADRDPATEAALTALLPAIATTPTDRQRIGHLLRTVRAADGGIPQASRRLQSAVSAP
ncbi:hypothetical protein [Streptomyces sp. NPDC048436]|uniref:hypothetical protein n=1 Tax=Streptomyces sp. NPDC048436 TaxID=3365550 RepID=UPI003717DC3B